MKAFLRLILPLIICILLSSCVQQPESESQQSSAATISEMAGSFSETEGTKDKIIITAAYADIFKDKTIESEGIAYCHSGDILPVIAEETDSLDKTWYKVQRFIDAYGWIQESDCLRTDQPANVLCKSLPGHLLDSAIDQETFIRIMMITDCRIENFIKILGQQYTKKDFVSEYDSGSIYSYTGGFNLSCSIDGIVTDVEINGTYYSVPIRKVECNIAPDPGEEIICFYSVDDGSELLITDQSQQVVIGNFALSMDEIAVLEAGDFLNNGNMKLFIEDEPYLSPDDIGNRFPSRAIYEFSSEYDMVKVFDTSGLIGYWDGIKASVSNQKLKLDVRLDRQEYSKTTNLPDRLFYDNQTIADKNSLLAYDIRWRPESVDTKWYLSADYSVQFNMLNFYYGPPASNPENNSKLLNDIARVHLLIEINGSDMAIRETSVRIKYDDTRLLDDSPVSHNDLAVKNGPTIWSNMLEGYSNLSGSLLSEDSVYEQMEFDGVKLYEALGWLNCITVTNPKYQTIRDIRVGDSVSKVESVYGKPDIGFSGDESADYKMIWDSEGKIELDYFRGIKFFYKNGIVVSFDIYSIILD